MDNKAFFVGIIIGMTIVFGIIGIASIDYNKVSANYVEPYRIPSSCDTIQFYGGMGEEITQDVIEDCQDYLWNHDRIMIRMNDNYPIIPWSEYIEMKEDCFEEQDSQWTNWIKFNDGSILFEYYCIPNYNSTLPVSVFMHFLGNNTIYEVIPYHDYSLQSEFFYGNYDELEAKYNVTSLRLP